MAFALTFTDADSNVLDLDDGTNFKVRRIHGAGIPPVMHHNVSPPLRDASEYMRTYLQPRRLRVELLVIGSSFANLQTHRRSLVTALNPKLGKGTLKYTPDATEYAIDCLVQQGAGFSRFLAPLAEVVILEMYCPDPTWYDPSQNTPTITAGTPGPITNAGDVPAAPVITATGAFNDIEISNDTAGKVIDLPGLSVGGGAVLTVDMGQRTVDVDGVSQMSELTSASVFWSLAKGSNTIDVTLGGGGAIVFTVAYYTPFLGI